MSGRRARGAATARLGAPVAAVVALGLVSRAAAAEKVETVGLAAIVGDDLAAARDRALDDAKRKAVEQVAGTHVTARTVTESFQLVEDTIYARASGFVRSYAILEELREGETYRVRIEAEVDAKALVDDLEKIFATKPRVIVLVAEQNIGADRPSYWWGSSGATADLSILQSTLIAAWQPRGYAFIDPGMLAGSLKVDAPLKTPDLSDAAARTLGRDTDADVAVVGKVLVNDAGPMMEGVKMHAYHAVGTLRALSIDTGEILAVVDDTGVAAHVDANLGGRLAIKALAEKAGGALEKKLLARWMAEAASSRSLELVLEGVKSGKELRAVEKAIAQLRGVESVRARRRKGSKVVLVVQVRARAQDFAQDLEAHRYGELGLALREVTSGRLVAAVERGSP